jgi:hypothetical protein
VDVIVERLMRLFKDETDTQVFEYLAETRKLLSVPQISMYLQKTPEEVEKSLSNLEEQRLIRTKRHVSRPLSNTVYGIVNARGLETYINMK